MNSGQAATEHISLNPIPRRPSQNPIPPNKLKKKCPKKGLLERQMNFLKNSPKMMAVALANPGHHLHAAAIQLDKIKKSRDRNSGLDAIVEGLLFQPPKP
jgi:hypothetical protein